MKQLKISIVLVLIYYLIGLLCGFLSQYLFSLTDIKRSLLFYSFMFAIFMFIFLSILISKLDLKYKNKLLNCTSINVVLVVFISLLISSILIPFNYPIIYFNSLFGNRGFELSLILKKNFDVIDYINLGFGALIVAPIFEEFFFKIVLFDRLLNSFNYYKVTFFVSFLFAFGHFNSSFLGLFFFCFISCLIFYLTSSLFLTIIFHSIYNFYYSLLFYVISFKEDFFISRWYFVSVIIGLFIVIYLLNVLKKLNLNKNEIFRRKLFF